MKKYYTILITCFITLSSYSQNYDYSLVFIGTNSGTGNYEFALVATPDFEQTDNAPTADMGAAIYIPSGYTLGNFATGNSNLQFFEWSNNDQNSYDGDVTDLVQLLRTDIVANDFIHSAGQMIELVIFEIISDGGDGNNPTTGTMTLAENSDPNVLPNFYESYLNINLNNGNGNGTFNYFGVHDPMGNSINFETLSIVEELLVESDIKIYPNPTTNIINIDTQYAIDKIEVYNIIGKLVLTSIEKSINLRQLDSGVYLLKVASERGNIIKRIIKK